MQSPQIDLVNKPAVAERWIVVHRTCMIFSAWMICIMVFGQTTHLIRGLDFYYLPDTVYMIEGDSVHFQTQTIHDMVQTDSSAWAIDQAIWNGGFVIDIGADTTFVIDTAGVYYFVCSPHGFVGMKGVLIVSPNISTTIEPIIPQFWTAQLGSTYVLHFEDGRQREIHLKDIQGRILYTGIADPEVRLKLDQYPKGYLMILMHDPVNGYTHLVSLVNH